MHLRRYDWNARFADELERLFVQSKDRIGPVPGLLVSIEDFFHIREKL